MKPLSCIKLHNDQLEISDASARARITAVESKVSNIPSDLSSTLDSVKSSVSEINTTLSTKVSATYDEENSTLTIKE